MASPHALIREPRTVALWAGARWSALLAVPLLLVWLVLDSASGLKFLWYIAFPILPATFFVSTKLWRGICPLATLNELGNRLGKPRVLAPSVGLWLAVAGLVLFHLMVPARRFVFNENGLVLAQGSNLGILGLFYPLTLVLGHVENTLSTSEIVAEADVSVGVAQSLGRLPALRVETHQLFQILRLQALDMSSRGFSIGP